MGESEQKDTPTTDRREDVPVTATSMHDPETEEDTASGGPADPPHRPTGQQG